MHAAAPTRSRACVHRKQHPHTSVQRCRGPLRVQLELTAASLRDCRSSDRHGSRAPSIGRGSRRPSGAGGGGGGGDMDMVELAVCRRPPSPSPPGRRNVRGSVWWVVVETERVLHKRSGPDHLDLARAERTTPGAEGTAGHGGAAAAGAAEEGAAGGCVRSSRLPTRLHTCAS